MAGRSQVEIRASCPWCGTSGSFRVSQGEQAWGSGFRVEVEPDGFAENGAASHLRAFRARCTSCRRAADLEV